MGTCNPNDTWVTEMVYGGLNVPTWSLVNSIDCVSNEIYTATDVDNIANSKQDNLTTNALSGEPILVPNSSVMKNLSANNGIDIQNIVLNNNQTDHRLNLGLTQTNQDKLDFMLMNTT